MVTINTPTASALRQQRDKILHEAFEFIFREFTASCSDNKATYGGYRLLAVDGSDLLTATGPSDPDSYYTDVHGQKPYNILHLNALYDLKQEIYVDAIVQKSRQANEHRALCDMVERSPIHNAILIADRGFESYNNLAHIQEKRSPNGWLGLRGVEARYSEISARKSSITSPLSLPPPSSISPTPDPRLPLTKSN